MELTSDHYAKLLGLELPWKVESVELNMKEYRVDITLSYNSDEGICNESGVTAPVYDYSAKRTWRHLDTMQFGTYIHAATPRVKSKEHGVKTVRIPWATKHSGFTLLFEAFAIRLLQASRSTEEASKLLKVNWHQLQNIMQRAVKRGLERRDNEEVPWVGMDEKSFRRGHRYVSILNDIEGGRVLDVVEGREGLAAHQLITQALDKKQREMVCGVCIDMSAPYISAINELLVNADIVHDKFHISKHLNDAVDKTRKREHARLQKEGNQSLKNTRYTWLRGLESLSDEALNQIKKLEAIELEVAKAWGLKELFQHFWTRRNKEYAKSYFDYWCKSVWESGIKEVQAVARTLKAHLPNILTYFDSYITNAFSEGINSKIQTIKSNARGFRNFENYRARILFFCGKLSLSP